MIDIAYVRQRACIDTSARVGPGTFIDLRASVVVAYVVRATVGRSRANVLRGAGAAPRVGRLWGHQATDKDPAAYDGLRHLPKELPACLCRRRTTDHAAL